MSKPADVYPKLTRAEATAQRKATQAALHAAREAEKAERALAKAAAIEAARSQARARAQELTTVAMADVPKTQGEVRAIAKAMTPRMLELLVEIAEDPMQQASGRVAAINAIIDRAHGKPVQPNVELPGDVLTDMDDASLDVFIVNEAKKFIDGKVAADVRGDDHTAAREDAARGFTAIAHSVAVETAGSRRGATRPKRGAGKDRKA